MTEPGQALASSLDAAERELDAEGGRWPATAALLAAVAVGISFVLPWRIGAPGTAMLSRPGYGDHTALLVWWGVGLAAAGAGLWLAGRPRILAAAVTAVAAAAIWYLSFRVAGTEVVDRGGALSSRRELTAGPGPALAVLAATAMLAATLVPLARLLIRWRSGAAETEFSEYALRDAVRRLRATRADRPVDTPPLD